MWKFIERLRARRGQGNPLPPALDLTTARRVLAVAPHPDDESMGCGGLLALLARQAEVQVLLVTNGDGGGALPAGTSETRKQELAEALKVLGIGRPAVCFDEPDGRFEDSKAFRQRFAQVLAEFNPDWVLLPWLEDSHSDHARIARACCTVLRRSTVATVVHYETWTPLPATHVVDITSVAQLKRAALSCHRTALQYGNYIDATFGLNAYRALYLGGQGKLAEAVVVRDARDCGQ
jgi:LmbE family N-acetylglucosaminyl deacetylase